MCTLSAVAITNKRRIAYGNRGAIADSLRLATLPIGGGAGYCRLLKMVDGGGTTTRRLVAVGFASPRSATDAT